MKWGGPPPQKGGTMTPFALRERDTQDPPHLAWPYWRGGAGWGGGWGLPPIRGGYIIRDDDITANIIKKEKSDINIALLWGGSGQGGTWTTPPPNPYSKLDGIDSRNRATTQKQGNPPKKEGGKRKEGRDPLKHTCWGVCPPQVGGGGRQTPPPARKGGTFYFF